MKYVNSWKGIKTEEEMKILKIKAVLFLENEGNCLQKSIEQRALIDKELYLKSLGLLFILTDITYII